MSGPTRWGRFELLARLGQGGAGTVYRARDPRRPGGEFALKLLDSVDQRAQKRFAREATALERLDHPHVVRVIESGVEAGRPYLLLELIQGDTLDDLLKRGPLPPRWYCMQRRRRRRSTSATCEPKTPW